MMSGGCAALIDCIINTQKEIIELLSEIKDTRLFG